MKRIRFHAMGSQITVLLESSAEQAQAWLEAVPGWFEEWEQIFSRFRESSELSRLNNAGGASTPVSEPFWQVLQQARLAWQSSSGLVSPILLAPLQAAGYNRSFDEINPEEPTITIPYVYRLASLDEIQFNPFKRAVSLPPGTGLDFGGVAKGWAAWQAATRLTSVGPALVNAGGDIAINSALPGGQLWPVGIDAPFTQNESLGLMMLAKCGVATSGRDRRRWQQNGRWQHHILDPRTGLPAQTDVISATIIAPDTMQAEAAAKTTLILGSQAGMRWLKSQPALAALIVCEDGNNLTTENFGEFLWKKNE
jgi:thiamine biosynthesis lipoprotein